MPHDALEAAGASLAEIVKRTEHVADATLTSIELLGESAVAAFDPAVAHGVPAALQLVRDTGARAPVTILHSLAGCDGLGTPIPHSLMRFHSTLALEPNLHSRGVCCFYSSFKSSFDFVLNQCFCASG